jgi:ATP-dependent RNA helicase DDX49/DBP8
MNSKKKRTMTTTTTRSTPPSTANATSTKTPTPTATKTPLQTKTKTKSNNIAETSIGSTKTTNNMNNSNSKMKKDISRTVLREDKWSDEDDYEVNEEDEEDESDFEDDINMESEDDEIDEEISDSDHEDGDDTNDSAVENDERDKEVDSESVEDSDEDDNTTAAATNQSQSTTATFESLGLAAWQLKICSNLGLHYPTEIQRLTIPKILAGHNVIGRAKTGSGKTAAFALPILRTLSKDPFGVYALILTPTRELAFQISEQFRALGATLPLSVCVVVGGMDMHTQALQCTQRPHIMIATPGRLADHLRSGTAIHFAHLKYLVLDECDRLFETCFDDDMQTIYDAIPTPNRRQTMLFSATALTPDMKEVSALHLKDPLYFSTSSDDDAYVKELDQRYLFIPQQLKESYLVHLLQYFLTLSSSALVDASVHVSDDDDENENTKNPKQSNEEKEKNKNKLRAKSIRHQAIALERKEKEGDNIHTSQQKQIIVFVASCASAAFITTMLSLLPSPIPAAALHSKLSQSQRTASLAMFRNRQRNVLIATDVASRGLDIEHVGVVINYDIPRSQDDYIHRIGRTARAGRGGLALTMISQYDITKFQAIEAHVGKKLREFPVAEESALKILKPVTIAKRMSVLKMEDWQIAHRKVNRLTKRKNLVGESNEKTSNNKKKKL